MTSGLLDCQAPRLPQEGANIFENSPDANFMVSGSRKVSSPIYLPGGVTDKQPDDCSGSSGLLTC